MLGKVGFTSVKAVEKQRPMSQDLTPAGRLRLLAGRVAAGVFVGVVGPHFSRGAGWILAIPAFLTSAWFFVAEPAACLPSNECPHDGSPGREQSDMAVLHSSAGELESRGSSLISSKGLPAANILFANCRRHMQSRLMSPARMAASLFATLLFASCAPLAESVVSLDGARAGDPASVATLAIDPAHPVLLRGVDGQAVTTFQVPNALRSWSFLLAPGSHRLWVSTVPYGHPLLPQSIGCYVIDAKLEPGARYVLRYDPEAESALLSRDGSASAEASGRLVDRPFVFERSCRWE